MRLQKRTLRQRWQSMKSIYTNHSHSSVKRGIEFRLSEVEFIYLTKQPCVYGGGLDGDLDANGRPIVIHPDRIDNTGHEEIGNVIPACGLHNFIRGRIFTPEEMPELLKTFPRLKRCAGVASDAPHRPVED